MKNHDSYGGCDYRILNILGCFFDYILDYSRFIAKISNEDPNKYNKEEQRLIEILLFQIQSTAKRIILQHKLLPGINNPPKNAILQKIHKTLNSIPKAQIPLLFDKIVHNIFNLNFLNIIKVWNLKNVEN